MNISPIFYQGIELDPGRYQIEVSADGFVTEKKWCTIEPGSNLKIDIALKKRTPAIYIKKVLLTVEKKFKICTKEDDYQKNMELRFIKRDVNKMLSCAGAVITETPPYDAQIIIKIVGTPMTRTYYRTIAGKTEKVFLYDTAKIEGSISFVSNSYKIVEQFQNKKTVGIPFARQAYTNERACNAPFFWAYYDFRDDLDETSFIPAFAKIMSKVFGVDKLKPIIMMINTLNPGVALNYLLLKPVESIDPLIMTLNNEKNWTFEKTGKHFRCYIGKCLKTMTGQDLGDDPSRWKNWWAYNKANVIEKGSLIKRSPVGGISYGFSSGKTYLVPVPSHMQ
ncbi:MAG: carboxypeptidase regulatory-like domain-containing protein [Deltaproteobacteria bacterium]|nr:carboxypeptidase regulatory-like domain-containing protein [Deltaproteobacteria bacterium]